MAQANGARELRRRPLSDLASRLVEDTTTLVRQEVELAKAEMAEKGKQAGVGAGIAAAGVGVAFLALGALTASFILALDLVLPAAVAALVVAIAYAAVAAVLIAMGRERLREASPPVPEQTVETVKEDVEWAKSRMRSAAT